MQTFFYCFAAFCVYDFFYFLIHRIRVILRHRKINKPDPYKDCV